MSNRLALLALFTGWSLLLTIESWRRPAATGSDRQLPQQIHHFGSTFQRNATPDPLLSPPPVMPDGLVLVAAADYSSQKTSPEGEAAGVRLRVVVHTRSGHSGAIPVERISAVLAAPGEQGRCVELDADGTVTAEFPTSASLATWNRTRAVPALQRLAWLAGLRPYQTNRCLWLGFRR